MYFEISPKTPDADFSWIIAKNPGGGSYVRQVGGASTGRSVVGNFLADGAYQITVHNEGILFFNEMKARNEAAYVRPEPWLVCPSNLTGFAMAFRSALHGDARRLGKDLEPERFFAPKHFQATIGPYPEDNWEALFLALGIESEVLEEGTKEAKTLVLRNIAAMSLTTFLQKIYISMMALTAKWAFFDKIDDTKVESYLRLTTDWLGTVPEPFRTIIVNKLTGYKKSVQARFAAAEQPEAEQQQGEETSASRKDDKEVEITKRLSLHEKRHALIIEHMPVPEPGIHPTRKIIDLGSGEGKLLNRLLERDENAKVIGVEARRDRIHRMRRGLKTMNTRAVIYHDNLLFPRNWAELVDADVLIASEVIEHLGRGDRARFIRLIAELLEPKMVFVTTPNIEANEPMFNMPPGELRHDDHRIEYTRSQFDAEVVQPLSAFYDVTYLEVLPGEPLQPSFCVKAVRKDVRSSPGKDYLRYTIQRMNEPSYFPMTNVTASSKDMREGLTAHTFLENSPNIFYLGPTVPPVDHISELDQYLAGSSEGGPYLEHPIAAFRYYEERDIRLLVEEPKYMGSRGYALIFKSAELAHQFGFQYPIVMNARSGGSFFKEPARGMDIWQDVAPKMKDDFIILDMEVMPWSLKAERLIARDFILPGEAALLWRRRQPDTADGTALELLRNTEDYLRMVKLYSENTPLEVRAFHVLAAGKARESKKHNNWMQLYDPRYGFYRTHVEQLSDIAELEGDIVKPVGYQVIDLNNADSRASSVTRWKEYCEEGGEGFVYKPLNFLNLSSTGYPIQPALKVRGKDYLRIIYGMDYLRPEYFDRLKERGTKMKRLLAIQEQEIAVQILRTYINGNEPERLRAVAAFLGLEWAQATTIDKTL